MTTYAAIVTQRVHEGTILREGRKTPVRIGAGITLEHQPDDATPGLPWKVRGRGVGRRFSSRQLEDLGILPSPQASLPRSNHQPGPSHIVYGTPGPGDRTAALQSAVNVLGPDHPYLTDAAEWIATGTWPKES